MNHKLDTTSFKKTNHNQYYLIRKTNSGSKKGGNQLPSHRNWFLIKYGTSSGRIAIKGKIITVPAELIGKKVRIKLEIINEKENQEETKK